MALVEDFRAKSKTCPTPKGARSLGLRIRIIVVCARESPGFGARKVAVHRLSQ